MKQIILILAVIISITPAARAENPGVAVVKGKYDAVDLVLKAFHIPFDELSFRDLESKGTYEKYHAVFFPCGMKPPVESELKVYTSRRNIQSISLKPTYREPDDEIIAENIRDFIEKGGAAYFSGYAYDYLQKSYPLLKFHNNFPYMGIPGRIVAELKKDLARFCMKKNQALYMTHPGWIAVRSVSGAEVLASAEYKTPRGIKQGPISIITRKGRGELLYTSYHSTVYSDFRRFNIYRIARNNLIQALERRAEQWEQNVTSRVVDAVQDRENTRMYYFHLYNGQNTLYFISEGDPYQVDILDSGFSLIRSLDMFKNNYEIEIDSPGKQVCYVKVYPSTGKRYGPYALISAHGKKVIPYFKKVVIGAGSFIILLIIFAVWKIFFARKRLGYYR